ncbi:metal ABC transporter substrate-binding protein [Pseudarthrobacter sp. NamB4]|uniref:metal ABC transporter substrate-binding protein n=1 Tax=Pseudarthrobacter sp. NamB4 TaxID=2576837 RepID=UPI001F0E5BDA|nr:metal ABC transporter substrate-binding protein [Pseudarthrobacter sp. NamB4]
MKPRTRLAFAMPLLTALSLTACSPEAPADSSSSAAATGGSSGLKVMASFYPLQYVTQQVGGNLVSVESLTPPGTEPHDLELSPASVAALESATAVVYLSGFQPAVDEAIKQASPARVLDVSEEATLPAGHSEEEHAAETHTDGPATEEAHADETGDTHGHAGEESAQDLHFWLDPERLAHTAHAVAEELGKADPANAAAYEANAETLSGKLTTLDEDFKKGLATCETRTIVVSHEAYGYLANKYDLKQAGISGLAPDTEPSPARLAEIGQVVKDEGVTTIFTETLVNPKVAETLAADLHVKTAVLDPLEGLTDESSDYEKVMRANLEALRTALNCA